MKKLLLIFLMVVISVAVIISFGCSKAALSGTYEGTLPAADGPGLQTIITFNSDGTFRMEETFLEKDVEPRITNGDWALEGDIITFTSGDYQFEYKLISEKEI
ncbi:MAG: copper resistance protein NlpE N-terminal domain-containing protein, partial [Candidatus Humimicrobiaceae bacterium]